MELKGSKTEACLLEALTGEAKAGMLYRIYAGVAKKEGFEQIADFFYKTAKNEEEHAQIWAKKLKSIKDTATNLQNAAGGEGHEAKEMYPRFAEIAQEEGFAEIAELFSGMAEIEQEHNRRFLKLLDNLNKGKVYQRLESVTWECRNCGYIHEGESAPKECPICGHQKAFFELRANNF